MRLNNLAIAGFGLACVSGWSPAYAADPFAAGPAVSRSWNGCYVGGHVGGVWGRGSAADLPFTEGPDAGTGVAWNSVGPTYETISYDTDASILGGAEVGCDAEMLFGGMRVVLGGVADISFTSLSDLEQSALFPDTNVTYSADWIGSLRARAGVATPQVLFFATGGVAIGRVDVRAFDMEDFPEPGLMDVSGGGTEIGWVVGGGAEWRFADRWSVSLEYLHHQFNGIVATGQATLPNTAFPRFDNDLSFDTVRVGIKFRM